MNQCKLKFIENGKNRTPLNYYEDNQQAIIISSSKDSKYLLEWINLYENEF